MIVLLETHLKQRSICSAVNLKEAGKSFHGHIVGILFAEGNGHVSGLVEVG